MSVHIIFPPNQQHAYLMISKNAAPFGIETNSLNNTYIFTIDKKTGTIYSSSIQNIDVFSSLNEAIAFLSVNFGIPLDFNEKNQNIRRLGSFLIGSSIVNSSMLLISVVEEYDKVASIFNHDIYSVKSVKSCALTLSPDTKIDIRKDSIIQKQNFFFSPTLDLSSPFPYHFINYPNIKSNDFCFNKNYLSEFVDNRVLYACIILIKGYVYSKDDFTYITKFSYADKKNFECECELIFKESEKYNCLSWRRGSQLNLKKDSEDFITTKKYISKEILGRFNIQNVRTFELNYNERDDINYGSLNKELNLNSFLSQDIICTEEAIQNIENELILPKIDNRTLFSTTDQNGDIISFQDIIFRFSSSVSFLKTDIIIRTFLMKLYNHKFEDKEDFFLEAFDQATNKLKEYCQPKRKSSFIGFFSSNKEMNDYNFEHDPKFDNSTKKMFLLDPQHVSYSSDIINNNINISYIFPEPFYICGLSFLVSPHKNQQQIPNNSFINLLINFSPKSQTVFQLQIPKVSNETMLNYDIESIMKKSLQYPYDPAFYLPTSGIFLNFMVKNGSIEDFTISGIQIAVKRKVSNPYIFIVPTDQKDYPKISDFGIDFDSTKPKLEDLVKNESRIDRKINCTYKNQVLLKNFHNPWLYDLKSQLFSKDNQKYCPFCSQNINTSFKKFKVMDNFEPILLIANNNNNDDDDDDDDDDAVSVNICPNCSQIIQTELETFKSKINNFLIADNSYSISYSFKKRENPLYFITNPPKLIDLSLFSIFSNQSEMVRLHELRNIQINASSSHHIHFFTVVDIKSIKIELNEETKFDDIQIKIRFEQDKSFYELSQNESNKTFEKEFDDKQNIHYLTLNFLTKNKKKSLICIKKIHILGSLQSHPVSAPRFEKTIDKSKTPTKDVFPKLSFTSANINQNRIQEIKVKFNTLYGIYLKSPKDYQSNSILVKINDECLNFIIPSMPKETVSYFPFEFPPSDVKEVIIMYLDCLPKINPFGVAFNGK